MISRIFLGILTVWLTACANPVLRSDVLSFHQWPANATDRTYQLKRQAAQEGSLEHASYENLLRTELNAAGFKEGPNARFAVTVDYAQQVRVHRVHDAPAAVSPSVWWSGGMYRSGWGLSAGAPIGPGYSSFGRDYPIYSRTVKLVIADQTADAAPRVWEGTANSAGSIPELSGVLPYMLRALLADFPGQSGVTRRVDVELPKTN